MGSMYLPCIHFDLWLFGLLFFYYLDVDEYITWLWLKSVLVSKTETLWQSQPENYKKLVSASAQRREIKSNCDTENTLGLNRNFTVIMIMATVVRFFPSSLFFLLPRFIRWMYSHLEKSVRRFFLKKSILYSIKCKIEQENGWIMLPWRIIQDQ